MLRVRKKPAQVQPTGRGPRPGTPSTVRTTGDALIKALRRRGVKIKQDRDTSGLRGSSVAGDAAAYGGKK